MSAKDLSSSGPPDGGQRCAGEEKENIVILNNLLGY